MEAGLRYGGPTPELFGRKNDPKWRQRALRFLCTKNSSRNFHQRLLRFLRGSVMKIRLEAVTNIEQEAAAARVRREVFGTEWAFELSRIAPNDLSRANQLIARALPDDEVVATVAILDTTGNRCLHEKYELPVGRFDRVARYTHMAVLKPYRGLNLPLYMLLEARQLYIIPGGFTYSWLLFQADRAISSTFCTTMAYSASTQIVNGEEGRRRVLLRNEKSHKAHVADMQTRSFLDSIQPKPFQVIPISEAATAADSELESSAGLRWRPCSGLVREDEWVAH
jgi:hypothetical protein